MESITVEKYGYLKLILAHNNPKNAQSKNYFSRKMSRECPVNNFCPHYTPITDNNLGMLLTFYSQDFHSPLWITGTLVPLVIS